jgi:hypothetical protein
MFAKSLVNQEKMSVVSYLNAMGERMSQEYSGPNISLQPDPSKIHSIFMPEKIILYLISNSVAEKQGRSAHVHRVSHVSPANTLKTKNKNSPV